MKITVFGSRDRADVLRDVAAELLAVRNARLFPAPKGHERDDRLTGDVVLRSDDGGLGHGGMRHE